MFHSSNSNNPFEPSFKQSSFNPFDQNPKSKQEPDHDPPFLFNFPSPFFDENELPLNQILLQNQPMAAKKEEQTETGQRRRTKSGLGVVPRRRTGKKDRHSKICTAQGIRDRRMRLSLQVARKFFDLQDMLGYDKASKTIDWLFSKSKKAIRELAKDHPQERNITTIKENSDSNQDFKVSAISPASNYVNSCEKKPAFNTRESRDKARERARCRTREKMMIKNMENSGQWCNIKSNPNNSEDNLDQKLGFSISDIRFEGVDEELSTHNLERIYSYGGDYSSFEDVGTIEKLLGSSNSSSSNSEYANSGYNIDPNSDFMGFLGNWDVFNNDRTSSIHYGVTNQVPLAGNPSSIFSDTPKFP